MLVRSRGGFELEPIGALTLKGLAEPVEAARLRWQPSDPSPSSSLPAALAVLRRGVFVGRAGERSVQTDALKRTPPGSVERC
jgi:hypothetical protein